jgi:hypothetical protein
MMMQRRRWLKIDIHIGTVSFFATTGGMYRFFGFVIGLGGKSSTSHLLEFLYG